MRSAAKTALRCEKSRLDPWLLRARETAASILKEAAGFILHCAAAEYKRQPLGCETLCVTRKSAWSVFAHFPTAAFACPQLYYGKAFRRLFILRSALGHRELRRFVEVVRHRLQPDLRLL